MPEIDRYHTVLSQGLRAAWPVLSTTVRRLKGTLVGGTALAILLQHRESFDLDYLTPGGFSGSRLANKLSQASASHELRCIIQNAETDFLEAQIGKTIVQIFRNPLRGNNPGYLKQIAKPAYIDGLPVASLADLLAMKLDVIMYRPKLRDYIDIAAIDQSRIFTIEEGLAFHAERYGTALYGHAAAQIVRLLESPGKLSAERVFNTSVDETLSYLKHRAQEVSQIIAQQRDLAGRDKIKQPAPPPTSSP